MIPHVLACTDYGWSCDKGNTVTVPFLLVLGVIVFLVAALSRAVKTKFGIPDKPAEPSRASPAARELLTGQRTPRYTSPVRAVTPGGIEVRRRHCCRAGHQSPAQSAECAAGVQERIERRGW